jgi:GTP-binding protein
MFVDEVEIIVRSGPGGAGCVSFRREARVPRGGPDGGDGGHGGDVILEATASITTLLDISRKRIWTARKGQPGQGANRQGRSAPPLIIPVPLGTLVYEKVSGDLLADLTEDGMRAVVARGGKGGRGNRAFATSTRQTPRRAEEGGGGEEKRIRLELKFLADVGLIGLPNAGKSTFLERVSAAHPNIAGYPFTTKSPVLGIVESEDWERIVIADIPGLVEGAHRGVGLGHRFLRHVERARILLHLVDVAPPGGPSPSEAYRIVREEMVRYSEAIGRKPQIVAANKMDLPGSEEGRRDLQGVAGPDVCPISAVTGDGVRDLLARLFSLVKGLT